MTALVSVSSLVKKNPFKTRFSGLGSIPGY